MPSLKFKSWLESRWGISSLEISLLSCQSWSWSFDCWFWNSPLPNVQKRYAILDCQKFLGSWMGWTGLLQGLQGGWYMWSQSNGNLICYCLKKRTKFDKGLNFIGHKFKILKYTYLQQQFYLPSTGYQLSLGVPKFID